MRLVISTLALVAMTLSTLTLASVASALEFTVVNATPTDSLQPGGQITIDVIMRNSDLDPVAGIGASAHGYDQSVVRFNSGQADDNYLNELCVAPSLCFGGLTNLANGALRESSIGANGDRVQIALSASLTPTTNSGEIDQGLDSVQGTAQFRLIFDIVGVGDATILIDTAYEGDAVVLIDGSLLQATGAAVNLIVLPEPGTAILMGLGLMGLASSGRSERARAQG